MPTELKTPPQALLEDERLTKVLFSGTSGRVAQIKNGKKMLWGENCGLVAEGEAYLQSLKNPAVVTETSNPILPAEPATTNHSEDLSDDKSYEEANDKPLKIGPTPAYAYLNNRWARFVVDGQEYSRDEFLKNKLDEDAISEVKVPLSCENCQSGSPCRLKITNGAAEVVSCCENQKLLYRSQMFEVRETVAGNPEQVERKKKKLAKRKQRELIAEQETRKQVAEANSDGGRFDVAAKAKHDLASPEHTLSNHPAAVYMRDLFQAGDFLCIQFIHSTETYKGKDGKDHPKTATAWGTLEDVTSEKSIAVLEDRNQKGWHVYVCMSTLKDEKIQIGSNKEPQNHRTKDFVNEIRAVFTEIDYEGAKRVGEIKQSATKGEIPVPHFILQSSTGKFQVIWKVTGLTGSQQEAVNKSLQEKFGGDPQAVDRTRVLRLPGFVNCKPAYPDKPIVGIERLSTLPPYQMAEFKLPVEVKTEVGIGDAVPETDIKALAGKVEEAMTAASVEFSPLRATGSNKWVYQWTIQCLNASEHETIGDTASVSIARDGTLGHKCFHAHCAGHDWKWFRSYLEKATGKKIDFPTIHQTKASGKQFVRKLTLIQASSLKPKHLRWFWENKILANKPNVFFGEPGLGKGFVGVDFIARMTTGQDFYDCSNDNELCDAVVCCSEDSWEETILPRLIVAGADTDRVYFLKEEHEVAGTVEEGLMALGEDLPKMAEMLKENPNVRIILIDPLATYMGELDPNHDKECRPVYTAMKTFAEKHDVCFVLIAHPNKNEEASAINRLSGAKALTSVFRNTWLVEKDPEDKEIRMLLSVKGNLAGEGAKKGLRFKVNNIEDTGIVADDGETIKRIGKLEWLGETDKDADEVLQAAAGGGKDFKRKKEEADALELLKEYLADGARAARDFYDKAALLGLSERSIQVAKARLKLKYRKIQDTFYWARTDADLDAKKEEIARSSLILVDGKTVV